MAAPLCEPLHVSLRVIRLSEQIVNAYMIIVCQSHQYFIRELLSAGFQIAVFSLGDTDGVGKLLLGQVAIFSHIPYSIAQLTTSTPALRKL